MSENHFISLGNSKINKEIVADDVSDDALRRLVNLNSGLRPKSQHKIIQQVKC